MSTSHDALFKYVFSQPENAADLLRFLLPPEVSARLDWSSLALLPGSFVDEHLEERHADLRFSMHFDERPAFVYVLFEHQSKSHPLMPLRMLRYEVRIWDSFLAAHPEARLLPAICGDGPISSAPWSLHPTACPPSPLFSSILCASVRSSPTTFVSSSTSSDPARRRYS